LGYAPGGNFTGRKCNKNDLKKHLYNHLPVELRQATSNQAARARYAKAT
jgi:hypothetical protein